MSISNDAQNLALVSSKSDLSGAPLHVSLLAQELISKGHSVTLVFSGDGAAFSGLPPDVKRVVLPGLDNGSSLKETLAAVWALIMLFSRSRPDVIHCHSTKASFVTRLACVFLMRQAVFTVHGWGFGPGRSRTNSLVAYGLEIVLGLVSTSRYVCVSVADRELGVRVLPWLASRMDVIHNGIPDLRANVELTGERDAVGEIRIIMVARVGYQKNHQLMSKVFARLDGKYRLTLVGHGTDASDFKDAFLANIPADRRSCVEFLGARSDVDALLAKSDIFILLSRFEGLPLSILEAMRGGLPVVASNVGGVNELVSSNGYLISEKESIAESEALKALFALGDHSLRSKMGRVSRQQYLEKFDSAAMIDALAQIYSKVGVQQ
ncbi:MAG: glycosyltransferase [Aquabacterium sp.]|uniref:glycosyltransferase n=1 Tax=Aquabacterium sp. TaxID=1872578 RepID=UPI003BD024D3